jgi:hypothetical protein
VNVDFYLGADTHWLNKTDVPLMVSHGRLARRKTLPVASAPWVCDSRGFSELSQYGRWTISPEQYADALRRYAREIGQLVWASPQDWMCEPEILAKTGLTIAEHQDRTVASVILLRRLVPEVHIIPVLQGWVLADYLRHVDLYTAAGIDLTAEPVVGLGSVCRRQSSPEIHDIVQALAALGLNLHGFGMKAGAVHAIGGLLESADSGAWSYGGRKRIGHCPHGLVRWEANCPEAARVWRKNVLAKVRPVQPPNTMPTRSAA